MPARADPQMGRDVYKDLTVRVRKGVANGRGSVRFASEVRVRVFRSGTRATAAFEAYRLRLRHARLIVWGDGEKRGENKSSLKD